MSKNKISIDEYVSKEECLNQALLCNITGLKNKAAYFCLNCKVDKNKKQFAFLFNIINFSYINKLYGFETGNEVLRAVGERLSEIKNIVLYKIDKDEFLFILDDFYLNNPRFYFNSFKRKLEIIFKKPFVIGKNIFHIKYNCVATINSFDFLLTNLEDGLKRNKNSLVSVFIPSVDHMIDSGKYFTNIKKLHYAIEQDTFFLEYQPIRNFNNPSDKKYECLVRFRAENGKNIYPNDFINLSQQIFLYDLITRKVILLAMKFFKDKLDYSFSINFDIIDIKNKLTVQLLLDQISIFPKSENIIIELTEVNRIDDFEIINSFIEEVQSRGAKIAIDDFGCGYSNFEQISKLDFDFLKIDGSIVKNLHLQKNYSIIKAIVLFCKENGIKTVGEFVSEQEDYNRLKELGVDYYQGWFDDGKPKIDLPSSE